MEVALQEVGVRKVSTQVVEGEVWTATTTLMWNRFPWEWGVTVRSWIFSSSFKEAGGGWGGTVSGPRPRGGGGVERGWTTVTGPGPVGLTPSRRRTEKGEQGETG